MKRYRHSQSVLAVAAVLVVAVLAGRVQSPVAQPVTHVTRRAPAPGHRTAPSPPPPTAAAITVSPGSDHPAVFWARPGGQVDESFYTSSWHGPGARGWRSRSSPSAAVDAAGHQYVFWAGAQGHIYEAYYDGRWTQPRDMTASYGWGRQATTSSPPAISVDPANGDQYLFWRTASGQIYEAWYEGRWHGPVNRGWAATSAPSATVNAAGHEYVSWVGRGGHIFQAGFAGRWSAPQDLTATLHWGQPGTSVSPPSISVRPGTDHQYLFWRAPDGRIYEAWYTTSWHGPAALAGSATQAPSAAVNAAGDQYVVWGSDGQIWEAAYDNGGWSGPIARWHVNPGIGQYVEAVQTSADLAQRMSPVSNLQFGYAQPHRLPVITVNDRVGYQHVTGVGAAMTDSSAWLLGEEVSPAARTALLADLFTTRGIHLAFTLIPMGASDFTVKGVPYTYDDLPANEADPDLQSFSIAHDQAYVLPVLRQVLAIAPHLETFAVPWSPPGWMKANNSLDDLQHQGTLLPTAYAPLAAYFVRFLQDYAQQGVPISALAPENEPRAASAFPALNFPEPDEAQWLSANLKPALAAAGLHPLVYGSDTSWSSDSYAQALANTASSSGLNGIAWHCYGGVPTVMSTLHYVAPPLDQLVTECAPNLSLFPVPEIVIGSLRNWASAVTLWNVALDPANGPVQQPDSGCHGCRGLLMINERTHRVSFNLSYYQLGQVGNFVESGAQRVKSNNFVTYVTTPRKSTGATPGLDDIAVVNPDGSRVLVAYDNAATPVRFAVSWRGRSFDYSLPAGAMVTFRWNP